MGDAATMSKKKIAEFTHWARPRWIRMYTYNYEYGESYYRPQVRYLSTSKVASDLSSSSYSYSDARRDYDFRRKRSSPPTAMSFIERWSAEPFYGRGYYGRRTSTLARDESVQRESMYRSSRAESRERQSRAESRERQSASAYRSSRAESMERESSEYQRQSRAASEMRSRRAQSEYSRAVKIDQSSNYASSNLLAAINSVRATSAALQDESAMVQERVRQRRARSADALRQVEMNYYNTIGASDDCLMRSDALTDAARRQSRAQSVLADIESRFSREKSLSRTEDEGISSEGHQIFHNYDYPRHHLVCAESCPMYTDPVHHRRFVIGPKFGDAAALGGFDVLYDPSVYKKTRRLLQRLSEERDVDTMVYESTRESSAERGRSMSRYAYNTRY